MEKPEHEADKQAIQQVLAGDRDAYRDLMDRHFHAVYRVAYRITGDPDDADDAAQEAFLRAYNSLASFRQQAAFSTWMQRIAMNTSINLVERRNRDHSRTGPRVAESPAPADNTIQLTNPAAGPETQLLAAEATTLRQAAMATLTPMERTAFTLRHMEGIALAEIGTALNLPTNSVKQAIFRAVAKLRLALAPLEGGIR